MYLVTKTPPRIRSLLAVHGLFHEAHGDTIPVYRSESLYNESKTRNYNIKCLVRVVQDLSELLP